MLIFAVMSDDTLHIEIDPNKHVSTIRELLGMEPGFFSEVAAATQSVLLVPPPPPDVEPQKPEKPQETAASPEYRPRRSFWQRDIVRLPLIFVISLAVFYLILNFHAVGSQIAGLVSPPPTNETAVLGQSQTDYDKWIKKYYAAASDPLVLAANEDADRDGLTNVNEFYLDTNPLNSDTDGDGYNDGTEVLNGYNPLYSGKLTPEQERIIDEHLKDEPIQERQNFQSQPLFQSVEAPGDATIKANSFVVEPTKAGNILIPKLGVNAAVIWTQDFAKMEDDLKYGVAHRPGTVYPGEFGMSSIHGHSSGYPWDGNYKNVFTRLNYLVAGDEVFVTVFAADGEERKYRYIVRTAKVFAKDDAAQFAPPGQGSFLNISTSWPIGTARERYVVTTELAGL